MQLGLDAFEKTFGRRPLLVRSGGTLPIVPALADKGIPTIITGFALPESNIHSPNERLLAEFVPLGLETARELFRSLAVAGRLAACPRSIRSCASESTSRPPRKPSAKHGSRRARRSRRCGSTCRRSAAASCGALLERVNADDGLKAWWHVANVNAVKRLGINDHSWVHIQIVANIALRLLRILEKRDIQPAMVADYDMKQEDAEVVVVLGALLHCVGMAVHRDRHEDWSLFLAEPKAYSLLEGLYDEPELTVVVSEVLQAITSHRESGHPLTLEAGIVRVADALDIEEGRSRIPFERGRVSIHSISAAAIDEVVISEGKDRAVSVEIKMNNSAGLYQVDELLKAKLHGSGLEPYVEVVARIETESEKSLVPIYRLE